MIIPCIYDDIAVYSYGIEVKEGEKWHPAGVQNSI